MQSFVIFYRSSLVYMVDTNTKVGDRAFAILDIKIIFSI